MASATPDLLFDCFHVHSKPGQIESCTQAVLAAPTGVVKLMDLLGDSHEVVRNEALLLLIGLAHASPEVKRIAAFEGAFGRLLAIIECVVHANACLQLCLHLQGKCSMLVQEVGICLQCHCRKVLPIVFNARTGRREARTEA